MRRIGILFFTLATISVWVLTHPLVQAQSKDEEFEFMAIGEGYTSEDFSKGINVGWRAFSAPDVRKLCASSPAPSQLLAREDHIEVTVGEPFSLGDLNIVAIDSEGRILKPIPIRVDIDANRDAVDDWDYQTEGKGLRALRPGTFRLLIRPFCNGKADSPKLIIHYTIKNN